MKIKTTGTINGSIPNIKKLLELAATEANQLAYKADPVAYLNNVRGSEQFKYWSVIEKKRTEISNTLY